MKKWKLWLALAACLALFTGCAAMLPDRLTAAAHESQEGLHSPVAGEAYADTYEADLYFRFLDEPMLASERRTLIVGKDASFETALVEALLAGPSAASPELRRLFADEVTVESTLGQGGILFVTLSESVLEPFRDEPAPWREDTYWREEIPLRRQLAMQSLAATLIENCGFESVQVLLHRRAEASGSMRLPLSYFDSSAQGLAPALTRDDSLLLGPGLTARTILSCYQQKDWERLYRYVALGGEGVRPAQASALGQMDEGLSLLHFQAGDAAVSQDGLLAILSCEITLEKAPGDSQTLTGYPLRLIRENGIWKISWQELSKLLSRW